MVAIIDDQDHTLFAPPLQTSPIRQRLKLLHRNLKKHTTRQQSSQVTVAIELKTHCTSEVLPFRHGPKQVVV